MEWIGLQEFQKSLSAKWVNISRMHFKYVPKNIQNGKVYLYTITEFTHLFVDIKHMRPVTEITVADLAFQF